MIEIVYRNLRRIEGDLVDIHCTDGRIREIASSGSPVAETVEVVDAGGQLLLPALVESHVHLDKTLWGEPYRPNTAGPSLKDYIANERRILREVTTPVAARAGALLEQCIAMGSLQIRSHIDVAPDIGLSHVEAMLDLRERYRDLADLQFVAFPQTGLLTRPGTRDLMDRALALGVEQVGGIDPAGIDNDPIGHLTAIFDLAGKHGAGLDIHLHDRGELGLWQIGRIADLTEAGGLAGKVMISHAYCLGMFPESRIEKLACRLADLGISLMTTAPADTSVPPVDFLRGLGVNICCGSDGIRDAWSPFGNGDMLERAFLLAFRFDWGKEAELRAALDCATHAGARALGLKEYGLAPGNAADFLYLPVAALGDALGQRPENRQVVRRGRLVASGGRLRQSRL
jgi:cytosine deaminase